MKLKVIVNDNIDVTAIKENNDRTLEFTLAKTLTIKAIYNNDTKINYPVNDEQQEFLPPLNKYQLSNLSKGTITIEYSGYLTSYFYFNQPEIIHFSYYNAWYPNISNEHYDIEIECDNKYLLINGTLKDNRWHYNTQFQQMMIDPNIILINKELSYKESNELVNVYYFDSNRKDYIQEYTKELKHIVDSLCDIYNDDTKIFNNVVFLPPKYNIGGYKRDQLMVFSEYNDDLIGELFHTAHELGHHWAHGANPNSWEDWLNETCANWSALLYLFDRHDEHFKNKLKEYQE